MNSRATSESAAPRTTRANLGIPAIPTASAAFHSPTPSTATTRIASTIGGKPSSTSIARAPSASTRPPA